MKIAESGVATVTTSRPVPVGELVSAWWAVQRGEFRQSAVRRPARATATPVQRWQVAPGEAAILVVGCGGAAGASTVALLLATVAVHSRVVDCAPKACSGLAGAGTAELGEAGEGWIDASRGEVRIQRRCDDPDAPELLPAPLPGQPGMVTVLDCWWELRQVLASPGWLGDVARDGARLVLVGRATVPGMRKLENSLALVGQVRCWAAVTGASARRLPGPVGHSMGPLTRHLVQDDRLVLLPDNAVLAVSGITTDPLPRSYTPVASRLLGGLLP
jgi:hypothetical protein